jgi:hypothetical protein
MAGAAHKLLQPSRQLNKAVMQQSGLPQVDKMLHVFGAPPPCRGLPGLRFPR